MLLKLSKGTFKVENTFISPLARKDDSRLLNLSTDLLIIPEIGTAHYIRPKVGT